MAPKKDKGKSQALVISSESKSLAPPISATELANRFTPLGNEISSATYSSTLVSPFDPFAVVSLKPSGNVSKPSFRKTSGYVALPFPQYLFSIELERSNVKSASSLAFSYFPRGFHWIYEHPLKNLSFYSNILILTNSVQIGPIHDTLKDSSKSFFIVSNFLKLFLKRNGVFTLPMKKNFLDLASNIIIMIILKLGPKFSYIKLPRWIILGSSLLIKISLGSFLCGLQTGGLIMVLIPDVLPLNFVGTFDLFRSLYRIDSYGSNFPIICHFAKMFQISWIIKWQYNIVGNHVERQWYCKWWDKFPRRDEVIEGVNRMAQAPRAQNVPLPSTISPKPISAPATKALPAVSPASSSTSLTKKERKKALYKQMMALEDEDSDEEDSASSAPIYDPQRNLFGNSGFGDEVPGLEDL
jgi:hypothetical protein